MRFSTMRGALALSAGIAATAVAGQSAAQSPPYPPPPSVVAEPAPPASPEAAAIASCLCLHRSLGALGAAMSARRQDYDSLQTRIGGLDTELRRMRATIDVDDAAAVARFRQLLAERDAAFRRSTGAAASNLAAAVGRYNAGVSEYNARCASQPRDPRLLAQVEANLSCPAR